MKFGATAGSIRKYKWAVIVEGKKTNNVYGCNVGAMLELP